jgi:uncharacterized protein (DUF2267 family)
VAGRRLIVSEVTPKAGSERIHRVKVIVEGAAQLAAQPPTLIRGVHYEGWRPARAPVKINREEFLCRVRREA